MLCTSFWNASCGCGYMYTCVQCMPAIFCSGGGSIRCVHVLFSLLVSGDWPVWWCWSGAMTPGHLLSRTSGLIQHASSRVSKMTKALKHRGEHMLIKTAGYLSRWVAGSELILKTYLYCNWLQWPTPLCTSCTTLYLSPFRVNCNVWIFNNPLSFCCFHHVYKGYLTTHVNLQFIDSSKLGCTSMIVLLSASLLTMPSQKMHSTSWGRKGVFFLFLCYVCHWVRT